MLTYKSKPITFDVKKMRKSLYRIDLEFWGIDHSGPSYEGRVFINNDKATLNTKMSSENGYAGSYYVFGHGNCFGDVGHCDIVTDTNPYSISPSHPLTPLFKSLIVTDIIKKIGQKTNQFVITIVPNVASKSIALKNQKEDINIRIQTIQIVTYNK